MAVLSLKKTTDTLETKTYWYLNVFELKKIEYLPHLGNTKINHEGNINLGCHWTIIAIAIFQKMCP